MGSWSIPADWYRSPEMAARERETIFSRAWLWAGRTEQVAEPGSYAAGRAGDLPWVITHARDGVQRAFANVCRHKAAVVCDGAGHAERLTCPYHGWTYRLDGRLASAPRSAGMIPPGSGVPRSLGLPPLGLTSWGPLTFVSRDLEARPLVEMLGPALTARMWEGADQLTWQARQSWDMACNWKVFVDNYLDGGYHIEHAHPSLDAQLEMTAYRTEVGDGWSLQTAPAATDAEAERRIGAGALYLYVWPNLMINRYGPVLDINVVQPIGPERCRVDFEFWFDRGAIADPESFIEDSIAKTAVTQDEDKAICERVQVGIASGTWERGPLVPQVEVAIAAFHERLIAALVAG